MLEEQGLTLITQEEFAAEESERRQLHLQKLEQRQKMEREQQRVSNAENDAVDASRESDAVRMTSVEKSGTDSVQDARDEKTQAAESEKSKLSLEENQNEILPSLGRRN